MSPINFAKIANGNKNIFNKKKYLLIIIFFTKAGCFERIISATC
ncbi:MAG: hypothetical protein ACPHY8_01745 [Patescibacteria group bacterium]